MHFTKYVIKEGSPAPQLAPVDLKGERRLEFCDAFGVANVGSLTFHELTTPYHHHPKGCGVAKYATSEGIVMHIAETADVQLPRAPLMLGIDAPPKFDANNVPDGTPGKDALARLLAPTPEELATAHGQGEHSLARAIGEEHAQDMAILRAECESLTRVAMDAKALADREARAATLAQSELSALRLTSLQTSERLRLAEQDREALLKRLQVERDEYTKEVEALRAQLDAATAKLDRLDKLDLSAAEQPADDTSDDADDAMNGE